VLLGRRGARKDVNIVGDGAEMEAVGVAEQAL
jgi:hypothetical protein